MTIDEPLLDRALDQLLMLSGVPEARRPALRARLGWDRDRPCTLEEAAQMLGVTRERIRQMQKLVEDRIRGRVRVPALERALEAMRIAVPTTADRAAQILIDQGIADERIHPAALVRLALLLGVEPGLEVVDLDPLGEVLVAEGSAAKAEMVRTFRTEVRRRARPYGFIHRDLVGAIMQEVLDEPEDGVIELMLAKLGANDLGQGWYYLTTDRREPAVRLLEDMLAVAGGSLSAPDVREGFARRLRWRGSAEHHNQEGWYPSAGAILSLCRLRPKQFSVEGERIRASDHLDWRRRLTGVEHVMVEVLLEAPGHVLHRDEFKRRVRARGVNTNTFSVYTTYSPFLRDLGNGLWAVRGVDPDPLEVERLKRRPRPRRRHVEEWEWLPDGMLRLAVRLRGVDSQVVGIPSAIREFLAERTFRVVLRDGRRLGQIKVDEDGTSWGYGRALRALGAGPGNLMLADFDIGSDQATIHVVADDQSGPGADHG